MKPLVVKKKDQVKGLYTYCKQCKRLTQSQVCVNTGKRISTCKTPEKHIFKAIVTVPNTNGKKKKTRELDTRDLKEAIRLKLAFEEELEQQQYQSVETLIAKQPQEKPTLLIECMALFVGYLNNVDIEEHKKKERSDGHIKDVERVFKNFCLCLKANGIDHTIVKIDQLNDRVVGLHHTYLLETKEYENKTYNNHIAQMRQFLDWLISKQKYKIDNPYTGVVKRSERRNKTTVTEQEFTTLLDTVRPENGIKVFSTSERKGYYRDWVKEAFIVALETGLRREEFITLQFSDVMENENGEPAFLQVENLKVNRILGIKETEAKKIKYVPITDTLYRMLQKWNYSKYKNKSRFLIAPNERVQRKTMVDFVSKSFTHFWKQTGLEKTAQLKNLRKTYLTALADHFGDKANIISDHASIDVMKEHYINEADMMAKVKGFSVFS